MRSHLKLVRTEKLATVAELAARCLGDPKTARRARAERLKAKFCLKYPQNADDVEVVVGRLFNSELARSGDNRLPHRLNAIQRSRVCPAPASRPTPATAARTVHPQ